MALSMLLPGSRPVRRNLPRIDQRIAEDLACSGLKPTDFPTEFKPAGAGRFPVDAYRMPYFDVNGHQIRDVFRDRALAPWYRPGEAKATKYLGPKGVRPHFYFPTCTPVPWRDYANDVSRPLLFVEGEKKAACCCKHGYMAIGISGVYGWRTKLRSDGTRSTTGMPLPDFECIQWRGRHVYIAFDADPKESTRRNVRGAAEALALELIARDAVVHIVDLPLGATA